MIGIYKITNPQGKVYIGQATNIEKRWETYRKLYNSKRQTHLYNSFRLYGVEAHKFEVVEICLEEELSVKERYWQEHYKVLSEQGLNCKLHTVGDKSGKLSEETKKRISEGQKGKVITQEQRIKISQKLKGRKVSEESIRKSVNTRILRGHHRHSEESKKKIGDAHRGKKQPPRSEETRQKLSKARKGKKHSEETLKKLRGVRGKQKNPQLTQKIVECPYCGKVGGNAMRRWHFENCKILK